MNSGNASTPSNKIVTQNSIVATMVDENTVAAALGSSKVISDLKRAVDQMKGDIRAVSEQSAKSSRDMYQSLQGMIK